MFSSPLEQQGAALLLGQPLPSLTEAGAETGLDFWIPGLTTSSPESQWPWGAAATVGSCSDRGNRGANGKSPCLHSGALIFCECYAALQATGSDELQLIFSEGVYLCPQRVKVVSSLVR